MTALYLLSILAATVCMGLVDHRWRPFLFGRPQRALLILVAGVGYFLVWDLIAIELGFYRRGASPGMTGVEVLPELALEELFFVLFLCYFTMVLHGLLQQVLRARWRR